RRQGGGGSVDGEPRELQGALPRSQRRQHRAAAGTTADPDLVWRLVRRRGAACRPARRRLGADHGGWRAGGAEDRRLAGTAQSGRTRSRQGRPRGRAARAYRGAARVAGGGGPPAGPRRRQGDVVPHVPHLKLRRSHRDLAPVQGSGERIAQTARIIASWPSCVRWKTWTVYPPRILGRQVYVCGLGSVAL